MWWNSDAKTYMCGQTWDYWDPEEKRIKSGLKWKRFRERLRTGGRG